MTGAGLVVGLLAGCAAAVAGVRRPVRGVVAAGGARPVRHRLAGLLRRRARTGDRAGNEDGRLATALVEVAALLRAGTAPADAWSLVLGAPVPGRVPTVAQLETVAGTSHRRSSGSPPLEAVVAAAGVADQLGAPLAEVLEQVAAAIAAQAEATADVEAALAGPRSSARVLVWLPLLGVLLGTALGANPVGVLLGGGLGTAAGVLGSVLVLVGRWWSGALLRRAARAGGAP